MRDDWPEWRGEINRVGPVDDPTTSFYTAPPAAERPRGPPPPSPPHEAALADHAEALWRQLVWMTYDGRTESYTQEMKWASDELRLAFWLLEQAEIREELEAELRAQRAEEEAYNAKLREVDIYF